MFRKPAVDGSLVVRIVTWMFPSGTRCTAERVRVEDAVDVIRGMFSAAVVDCPNHLDRCTRAVDRVPAPEMLDLPGLRQYADLVAMAVREEFAESQDEEEAWLAQVNFHLSDADTPNPFAYRSAVT